MYIDYFCKTNLVVSYFRRQSKVQKCILALVSRYALTRINCKQTSKVAHYYLLLRPAFT